MKPVNLDANARTPVVPEAVLPMRPYLEGDVR